MENMAAKYEDEKLLAERFCQVMAETIGSRGENTGTVEWAIFPY